MSIKLREELHHIATGGTLDSEWDPAQDTAVPRGQTIVPGYLEHVRLPKHDVSTETIAMLDSRRLNVPLQDRIAERVVESNRRRILTTMGTYGALDIAQLVQHHPGYSTFGPRDKKSAITASGIPIGGYLRSDGGFSLGMGVAVLQEPDIPRNVLVMNGMCFDVARGVRKDLSQAIFAPYHGKDLLSYDGFTLIPAGGTMDFELDGLDGLVPAAESAIPAYLRDRVKLQRPFNALTLAIKDSRDLVPDDMAMIRDAIRSSTAEHALVTLGIYRMRDLQKFLREHLKGTDAERKVVLTGSRYPLRLSDMTDAPFNLGYALGKISFVRRGVNIAMNGMVPEDDDDLIKLLYTMDERDKLQKMGAI